MPTERVAEVVARNRPDVLAAIDRDQNCERDAPPAQCLAVANRISRLEAIYTASQKLGNELRAVGAPGEDVRALFLSTVGAVDNYRAATVAMEKCVTENAGGPVAPCEPAFAESRRSSQALGAELRRWDRFVRPG